MSKKQLIQNAYDISLCCIAAIAIYLSIHFKNPYITSGMLALHVLFFVVFAKTDGLYKIQVMKKLYTNIPDQKASVSIIIMSLLSFVITMVVFFMQLFTFNS